MSILPANRGTKSSSGTPGPKGQDGKSAYQVWLDLGNEGTESDFINSLEGDVGPQGIQGSTGLQGVAGPQGVKGDTGLTGQQGIQGIQGIQGVKGDKGDPGISPVLTNSIFRASFSTTSAEATQYCTTSNIAQAITFNTQQIPNTTLGTLTNNIGVFQASSDIIGTLSYSSEVRRTTGGASPVVWGIHIETSTDGINWTPVAGSSRRINLRGGGENNIMQTMAFTTSVNLPTGTYLRFMQFCNDSTASIGLVAAPAQYGSTTAAGFIFSLHTIK